MTRDDTAKAGENYVQQSGTLIFQPLEVSKEVAIPLLPKNSINGRQIFALELTDPSSGYAKIASTLISIIPDTRISVGSLRPRADGSFALRLLGTVPGITYWLEVSSDLRNWSAAPVAAQTAAEASVAFDLLAVFQRAEASAFAIRRVHSDGSIGTGFAEVVARLVLLIRSE